MVIATVRCSHLYVGFTGEEGVRRNIGNLVEVAHPLKLSLKVEKVKEHSDDV